MAISNLRRKVVLVLGAIANDGVAIAAAQTVTSASHDALLEEVCALRVDVNRAAGASIRARLQPAARRSGEAADDSLERSTAPGAA
jgi:hypothetical protein